MTPGPLIIVSGPSGSGKSTLIHRVLAEGGLPLRLSVSATTRAPRQGEVEGVDYYFWTPERFREELAAGAFLEHAEVHGRCYGTLRREVGGYRALGQGVILDIDVQGAAQVRPLYPEHVSIFIEPPSLGELDRRLRDRETETEEAIALRLANARAELAHAGEYQERVINDDQGRAWVELRERIARHFRPPFPPLGVGGAGRETV
jgi:guanylate kinase